MAIDMEGSFLTKSKFSKMVKEFVHEHKVSHMDAVVEVCERNNIEMEDIKKYVTPIIKDKIQAEAQQLNMLPKVNTLPIE